MAISVKEIGNDPIYGREIISPPLNYNFELIQNLINQHILDIANNTAQISTKANANDVYTIGDIDSGDVNNISSVTGSKVTTALDTLKNLIDNIVAGDSNASIGIYKFNDMINTNSYVSEYGSLTLFAGLIATLSVANINTGSSTLDITDGSGIKNIKKYKSDGTKELLTGGEIYGTIILYYDGVDWINLSYNYKVGNLASLNTTEKSNIVGAINEIDANMLVILENTGSIPTTGWVANTGDYALKNDITISGILATDWIDIVIDKDSHDIAGDAEICPTVTEGTDTVTMYCNTAPTEAIPFKWKVVR